MSQFNNENNNPNYNYDLNITNYKIKIEDDYIPQRNENFETENDVIDNKNIFEGNADKKLFGVINSEIKEEVISNDPGIVSDNLVTYDNYSENIPQSSKIHKHILSGTSIVEDGIKPNYTNADDHFVYNSTKTFDKPFTLKIKRVVSSDHFDASVKVEDNLENYLNDNGDSFQQVPFGDQLLKNRRIVYENHVPVDVSVKLEDDLYNHLIGDSFCQDAVPSSDKSHKLKVNRVAENYVPVNATVKIEGNGGDSFYQDVNPSGDRSLKLKIKRVTSGNHVAYATSVKLEDNFNSDQFDCGIFNSEPSSPGDKSDRYNAAHLTNDFNYKTPLDSSKNNANSNVNPDHVTDPKDSYYSHQRSRTSKISLEDDFDDVPTDSSDPDYEPPVPSKSKIKWVYPRDGSCSTSNKLEDESSKSSRPKTKRIHRRAGDSGGTKKALKDKNRDDVVDSEYNPKVSYKSGLKRISCKICGMKFAQIAQLTRHNVVYHTVKPFKCEICDRRFLWVTDLAIHNRVHSGEKPYTCEVCNRSFAFKSTFTIHKRLHSGDKPYKCNDCDKRFVCTADMNRHKRIHSGTMPYTCDVCKRKFRFSSNFSKHKRTHEEH